MTDQSVKRVLGLLAEAHGFWDVQDLWAEVTCIIIFLYRSFNLDSDYRYQLSHFLPFCDLMISTNFISLSYFRVLFNAYEFSTCSWRYPGFLPAIDTVSLGGE